MGAFTEMPPMLKGSAEEQTLQLRNYLVRLARSLGDVQAATQAQIIAQGSNAIYSGSGNDEVSKKTQEEIMRNAQELQQLILSTANNVIEYTDRKIEELNGLYVAESEFGTYKESVQTTIVQTAKSTVESYDFQSQINSANDSIGLLQNYYTTISGEIRRGLITVTENGQAVTYVGIAISQNLRFKGEVDPTDSRLPEDGQTYYEIASGQTFGLYTSTGWQFWINGVKKGWFDSKDGLLHIANMDIEGILTMSGLWAMRCNSDGKEFELYYVGG